MSNPSKAEQRIEDTSPGRRRSVSRTTRAVVFVLLLVTGAPFSVLAPAHGGFFFRADRAFAGETTWKEDFDVCCGKTQDAMSLSPDELRALIKSCDELKVKVDALEGAAKKVAQKRLQMCRDLYSYVLDQKEKK